jgi:hypothetical protein
MQTIKKACIKYRYLLLIYVIVFSTQSVLLAAHITCSMHIWQQICVPVNVCIHCQREHIF